MLQEFINHLDAVTCKGEQFKARCPAHDDKKPSLAITEKDGKILLKCWSGCTTEEIVSSLGLKVSNLFTDSNLSPQQRQQYAKKKTVKKCLEMLEIEVHIFYQCLVQLLHTDTPLSDEDKARNIVAQNRIIKLIGQLNDTRRT